ncbi:T9SS type A sorting domain-containing protein [Aequorivita sp. H23M31]|uniref:T9SS type A sorting domain-containing protein n=1 Tax=Aequorivita ciconiae TaxID=2494375 RepID=A0A410G5E3_9FLAO|nr:T9SS-dependent M36 family metallopeptidase [Aequorivita sp. H23M31]QAA82492.1 T9SS type A sorting domain-containing protein [Aequorivita sp. H23M31]
MKKIIYLFVFLVANLSFSQDFSATVNSYLKDAQLRTALKQKDIADISIASQSYSKSLKAYNVYVEQHYQGIKIYNSVSPFVIRDGRVLTAKLSFVENLSKKVNTSAPSITALAAISKATNGLGIDSPSSLSLLETGEHNAYVFSNGNISLENIPVQLVYQRVGENESLKLAWDLSIYLLDGSHYYSVRVDALTGELLVVDDWVVSCNFGEGSHSHGTTESVLFPKIAQSQSALGSLVAPSYRVFPIPLVGPNEGADQLVSDPSNALASPYGWHDINGAPGEEFTTTRGNNVLAREDHSGTNGAGHQADGGATLTFDFPYNLPDDPYNFMDAAITNLFYMNNIMHDVFYQYGFDEESGNFQANNYGRGGNQGDFVFADAQDGSGTNNANFATGPDGVSGRMQMYLWTPRGQVIGSFLTVNNGPLAGKYYTTVSEFGPDLPTTPITANLVLVQDDNSGPSEDPHDACDVILNVASVAGKIAVIRRGNCDFVSKVEKAQTAGAIAVVMVNNVWGDPIIMGGEGPDITIPAIMIYQNDGEAIISSLQNGNTINATIIDDGSGVDTDMRDGDLDNVIIAHEYGHGISNRLTGGRFTASCLMNDEQMGEGWSDYFGLMLTMKPTDVGENPRGIGTYALSQGYGGLGLRTKPYSTDFTLNNFTYNSIKSQAVPHGVGSVWTTMLWDMTWAFIDEYGFDADIYEGQGGNNMALQLVVDALKIQPCSPGFVDGRDAILQADEIANGGANRCLIWRAFAKRGLGLSANQGSSSSKLDGTAAFDVPEECQLGVGDLGSVENNFIIYPNPSQGELNIEARIYAGPANLAIYDMNGRKVFNMDVEITQTRNIDISSLKTGIYLLKIEGGGYTQTTKLVIK